MKNCRAHVLGFLASALPVVAMLAALSSAPSARADETDDDLEFRIYPLKVLIVDDDKPIDPAFKAYLLLGIFDKSPTLSTSIATGQPARKSAPNYGTLTRVPGTVDASQCAGSSGVAAHPSGRFVYMSGGFGSPGRMCAFAIDPVTQALTSVTPEGGMPVATGTNPGAVAIEPSGRFVYVAGDASNGTVSGYGIDRATGLPTPVSGSPFQTSGSFPGPIAVDRSGRFIYVGQSVGNFDGSIAVFAIDATTGALTPLPGSPFPNVADGGRIASLALTPDGRFLYAGGSVLGTYSVNPATGVPTRVASRSGDYFGLAVDPTGRFLYAPSFFGNVVHGFSIASDGALAPVGTPQSIGPVSRGIVSVVDLVYVASSGGDQTFGFRINAATGGLTPVAGSPFATPSKPNALAASGTMPESVQVDAGDYVVAPIVAAGGRPPYLYGVASGALPPGLTLNASTGIVSVTANTAGAYAFTVRATDSRGTAASTSRSIRVGGGTSAEPVTVVEFHNAALDHYFITYVADEIAKLDNGTFMGWVRTGLAFKAFGTVQSGTSAVCRIYIPPGKGDGHFFGRDTSECTGTITKNPTFILESDAFFFLFPPTLGNCGAGQIPVYRMFSNRADANHRYTTVRAVRDQMVGKGWLAEGDGADTDVMCAPG